VLDDFRDESFILFFRVLPIENAVLLPVHVTAPETVLAALGCIAVENVCICPTIETEEAPLASIARVGTFVVELAAVVPRGVAIHEVL
jgi:hypothetical protein